MTTATILFFTGLALLVGPILLKLLLGVFSVLVPATIGTTIYLCFLLMMFIGCVMMYGKTFRASFEEEEHRRRSRIGRKRCNIRKAIMAVSILAGLSIILIALNSVFTVLYKVWSICLKENPNLFAVLRHVGFICIVGSVGFFIGMKYKEEMENRKNYDDTYDEVKGRDSRLQERPVGERAQYYVRNLGAVSGANSSDFVREEEVRVQFNNPEEARKKLG